MGECFSCCRRDEQSSFWWDEATLARLLWTSLDRFPKELIPIILSFTGNSCPPLKSMLPIQMLYRPPLEKIMSVENLIGSAVYLVNENDPSPNIDSPFLIVWAHERNGSTFFGVIFPSLAFDKQNMSLCFGPEKSFDLYSTCLIFYDLDLDLDIRQNTGHHSSLCKIHSINLAQSMQRNNPSCLIYPVYIVQISGHLLLSNNEPYYRIVHHILGIALTNDPSWPWNQ